MQNLNLNLEDGREVLNALVAAGPRVSSMRLLMMRAHQTLADAHKNSPAGGTWWRMDTVTFQAFATLAKNADRPAGV
jgi:hypothetical protein